MVQNPAAIILQSESRWSRHSFSQSVIEWDTLSVIHSVICSVIHSVIRCGCQASLATQWLYTCRHARIDPTATLIIWIVSWCRILLLSSYNHKVTHSDIESFSHLFSHSFSQSIRLPSRPCNPVLVYMQACQSEILTQHWWCRLCCGIEFCCYHSTITKCSIQYLQFTDSWLLQYLPNWARWVCLWCRQLSGHVIPYVLWTSTNACMGDPHRLCQTPSQSYQTHRCDSTPPCLRTSFSQCLDVTLSSMHYHE